MTELSNICDPETKQYSFEDYLNTNGYLLYTNVGTSMLPLIRQRRDIIEIRRKGLVRCKKYDTILYKRGSKYILHRILKVTTTSYIVSAISRHGTKD